MKYTKVHIEAFGYELAPVAVTTAELEERVAPLYNKLHIPMGQIEHMTGISERRWWQPGFMISDGAIAAGQKALARTEMSASDIETLIFGSVCREYYEPATACAVASGLGVSGKALVYDITNACLGALNGIIDIANQIELGQIRAGMIVVCESAREINETMIDRLNHESRMDFFATSLATLTGGSGAVAILLTDGSFSDTPRRKLLGGVMRAAPEHHKLCKWGIEQANFSGAPDPCASHFAIPFHYTDAPSVMKHGVALGQQTFQDLQAELGWTADDIDKTISHQVGSGHRDTVMDALGIDKAKDFSTYPFLGNTGTVALPITAAIAEDRGFLRRGNRVAFMGIGSGLNCMMLGLEW